MSPTFPIRSRYTRCVSHYMSVFVFHFGSCLCRVPNTDVHDRKWSGNRWRAKRPKGKQSRSDPVQMPPLVVFLSFLSEQTTPLSIVCVYYLIKSCVQEWRGVDVQHCNDNLSLHAKSMKWSWSPVTVLWADDLQIHGWDGWYFDVFLFLEILQFVALPLWPLLIMIAK